MARSHSFLTEAIILKRTNTGEADRLLTVFTPEQGKVRCVAKGVRKLSSSQRAFLEPGNFVDIYFIETKNLPLVTQTRLKSDFAIAKSSLKRVKQLWQVLEIAETLFPEGEAETELFSLLLDILENLNQPKPEYLAIKSALNEMMMSLGYQSLEETKYSTIGEYVAVVADKPLHSYDFLSVGEV